MLKGRGKERIKSTPLMMKLYYGWFQVSLHQEIKNRREICQLFPEYQIWYLMFILLRVAAYF